jgi:hypothetical protein
MKIYEVDMDELQKTVPDNTDFVSIQVPAGYTHILGKSAMVGWKATTQPIPEICISTGIPFSMITPQALQKVINNPDAYVWIDGKPMKQESK